MGEPAEYQLHELKSDQLLQSPEGDNMTIELLRDLFAVISSVHRGMPVYGPWFEERVRSIVVEIIPENWCVSGPSQIYDPDVPGIRSRSWDLVIHHPPVIDLPPAASSHSGFPLLPKNLVGAVIDTKTMFGNVADYAAKTVNNLQANHTQRQLDFLGGEIRKVILAASSTTLQSTLWNNGQKIGIDVYCLSKSKTSRVNDWSDRTWEVELQLFEDGTSPFRTFLKSISDILASFDAAKGLRFT